MAGTGKGEVDPPILVGRIGGKKKGRERKDPLIIHLIQNLMPALNLMVS